MVSAQMEHCGGCRWCWAFGGWASYFASLDCPCLNQPCISLKHVGNQGTKVRSRSVFRPTRGSLEPVDLPPKYNEQNGHRYSTDNKARPRINSATPCPTNISATNLCATVNHLIIEHHRQMFSSHPSLSPMFCLWLPYRPAQTT